jgi:dTDP-4-amino-4,6-dideoxygalactose transaminase
MINSGEGGFLLTDDPEIAAQTAVIAGAYEGLAGKHVTVPGPEHFEGKPVALPNYSIRMSNLAAAVIRPQIKTLEPRIEKYNKRYNTLVAKLEAAVGDHMYIPQLTPGVTRMVHDSVQFNLDEKFTPEMLQEFLTECGAHGLPVELFGHKTNARNFINWGFAPADTPLPELGRCVRLVLFLVGTFGRARREMTFVASTWFRQGLQSSAGHTEGWSPRKYNQKKHNCKR